MHVIYDREPDDVGELMTVAAFKERVADGAFIDYDGFGSPLKDGRMADVLFYPSQVEELPPDATHILWYNR